MLISSGLFLEGGHVFAISFLSKLCDFFIWPKLHNTKDEENKKQTLQSYAAIFAMKNCIDKKRHFKVIKYNIWNRLNIWFLWCWILMLDFVKEKYGFEIILFETLLN